MVSNHRKRTHYFSRRYLPRHIKVFAAFDLFTVRVNLYLRVANLNRLRLLLFAFLRLFIFSIFAGFPQGILKRKCLRMKIL